MFSRSNILFSILIVLLFTLFVNAQEFALNLNTSIPTGEYGDVVDFGYSGGISVYAPIYGFTGVAYAGYGFWSEKSNPSAAKINFTNFPVVLAGARSYYGNFYLSTLAGIYPVKLTVETESGKTEEKETQGAVYAGFGYVFPVQFFHIDLSVNYLWSQDYPQVQIGASFLFNH